MSLCVLEIEPDLCYSRCCSKFRPQKAGAKCDAIFAIPSSLDGQEAANQNFEHECAATLRIKQRVASRAFAFGRGASKSIKELHQEHLHSERAHHDVSVTHVEPSEPGSFSKLEPLH